jgi:isoleucyl-tRNA synthetase
MEKPRAYRPVESHLVLPDMEARVLRRWASADVFARSLAQRRGEPEWVFYEGPPTANGKPGIHHVEARAFKDVFCRFQTMSGRYVHRKAGWDCHGLPVEIAVEQELGVTQKREIEERVGIAEFTRRCRESVQRYVDDWAALTDRIGFWVDLDDAYWTMSSDYVESVWWLLKQIWDKGLLEEDFKVVPYCPRCETALSNHEQHQIGAYQPVVDPSLYVRFVLRDDPASALLVWTTTPWTLLANMAAAVAPEVVYVKVADPHDEGRYLIIAKERMRPVLGDDAEALEEMTGADLAGRAYVPPFEFVPSGDQGHRVRPGGFVSTAEGTGIVHLAPYGEDDMAVAKRDQLPVVQMIDGTGHVVPSAGPFAGLWFKDADAAIVADLERRRALFACESYQHAYPHCWRCNTPLLYYARKDWYIRTSQLRDQLQASNEEAQWQPPTIKYGRFGDWLANNVDWSLSRDRYWGTPLPVWRCANEHAVCIGSFAELSERAGRDLSGIDPHRPHIDAITFSCPECSSESKRVKSVIDAWFDSGSMPFAQWHYPFENDAAFEARFPADFISEAIDQTRGWFYSLLAIATMIRGHNSYRNVVCLGHIVDEAGKKMSKSLGNVIDPWAVIDEQGADAMRWLMLTGGTPWSTRRVGMQSVQEALRKYLLTLWNTYSFWVTYASLEAFDPTGMEIPVKDRPAADRWVAAELTDTVREVTGSLEGFDATRGGRRLERFVDDLSNWYVRTNRRRFWGSVTDSDTKAAFITLWECLVTAAKLTAPFTPFISDEIFVNLTALDTTAPESVHLADWPKPDDERVDDALVRRMKLTRTLVALGRSARTEAKVRVRQPLGRAVLVGPALELQELGELTELIADELNVKVVDHAHGIEELIAYSVKPNFKTLGPRLGARVKDVARSLARADAHALVARLENEGRASVMLDGQEVELGPDELDVRVEGRRGFSLAREGAYGVALDVELTPELRGEGAAREVVRAVQDLRKASGLAVEDRIELWLSTSEEPLARALKEHLEYISSEVLATTTHLDEAAPPGATTAAIHVDGATVVATLERCRPG